MYRYWIILLIFIPLPQNSKAQLPESGFNIDLQECYIVARGTRSKQAFISKKFNIVNDSITHIGIGVTTDSGFRIYNVNPVRKGNALFIEDMRSYFDEPDLVYAGIWKLVLDDPAKTRIRDALNKWQGRFVDFDSDFLADNRDSVLYCSEFCWQITSILGEKFSFDLLEIETRSVDLEGILKREKLFYVPVDYFLLFSEVVYCGSWSDKNFKF